MGIFEYLTGRGGIVVLGLFVAIVVLYTKIRDRNQFRRTLLERKTTNDL